MDGHHGAGLDGVEHTLGVVLGTVAEVEVAAQCARCARWDRQRTGWGLLFVTRDSSISFHVITSCLISTTVLYNVFLSQICQLFPNR